ncbi:MAG: ABC transporter ATP-binding protein [Treponema sp.]|jgi:ABC-2 type transport system ATP-binding protein|nr:ABC transporter ATP-binding protein [Treponema sp.]
MVEVRNLSRSYGTFEAVRDVSFFAGKKEVIGLLGPNGAGKTTIMRILAGFHFPSGGSALVDGISLEEDPVEAKKRIGYLPENVPLYGDLTVEENLRFIAEARLVPAKKREGAVQAVLEACGLSSAGKARIETLSRGFRQRTGLAQALVHDPPVLVLDEPATGLDPNQIVEIRSLIKELGKRKTVILSTHILAEAEAVCSRLLILNRGRVAAQGKPGEIRGAVKGGGSWELLLKGADVPEVAAKTLSLGKGVTAGPAESEGPSLVRLHLFTEAAGDEEGGRFFDWAAAEGIKILSMNRKRPSMEDVFIKLTAAENPGETAGGKDRGGPA